MSADELTDDDWAFIFALVEDEVASGDTDRQDKALEVREKIPEPSYMAVSRWR